MKSAAVKTKVIYEAEPFFAHLSRMKLINRWPLMRNVRTENVSEHSLQVAMVAHALAAIKNRKFGGQLNAERISLLAMYHDASEVLTGDLPTPVKYFNSQIAQEYKAIEKSPSKSWLIWRRMNYAIFSHRLLMRMHGAKKNRQS